MEIAKWKIVLVQWKFMLFVVDLNSGFMKSQIGEIFWQKLTFSVFAWLLKKGDLQLEISMKNVRLWNIKNLMLDFVWLNIKDTIKY